MLTHLFRTCFRSPMWTLSHDLLPPFSSFHTGGALKMKTPGQHINLTTVEFSFSCPLFYFEGLQQLTLASKRVVCCASSSFWVCCVNAESTACSPHFSYINLCRWPLRAAARSCGEQGLWSLSAIHKSRCGVIKLRESLAHLEWGRKHWGPQCRLCMERSSQLPQVFWHFAPMLLFHR